MLYISAADLRDRYDMVNVTPQPHAHARLFCPFQTSLTTRDRSGPPLAAPPLSPGARTDARSTQGPTLELYTMSPDGRDLEWEGVDRGPTKGYVAGPGDREVVLLDGGGGGDDRSRDDPLVAEGSR